MIIHVFREQKSPLFRTGWAEIKGLTTERTEVLESAVRIGALDTGDALGVVSAKNELLHDLLDPLDSETSVDDSVLVFVLIGDALKMFIEQKLDRFDPVRLVDLFPRRGERKE